MSLTGTWVASEGLACPAVPLRRLSEKSEDVNPADTREASFQGETSPFFSALHFALDVFYIASSSSRPSAPRDRDTRSSSCPSAPRDRDTQCIRKNGLTPGLALVTQELKIDLGYELYPRLIWFTLASKDTQDMAHILGHLRSPEIDLKST